MLTYGQKTSQDVSYMTTWDETVLQQLLCPSPIYRGVTIPSCHDSIQWTHDTILLRYSKTYGKRLPKHVD